MSDNFICVGVRTFGEESSGSDADASDSVVLLYTY